MAAKWNPFFITGKIPSEYFCDRKEETQQMLSALTNQENVVITSQRRMGRMSLIYHVLEFPEIQDSYYTIVVDIMYTTTFREFVYTFVTEVFKQLALRNKNLCRIFVTAMRSLSSRFTYDPIRDRQIFDVKLGDISNPEYTLGEVIQYLERVNKNVLVVIDEFQQITKYPEKKTEDMLRSHMQYLSNCIFVFSGSQRYIMERMLLSNLRPFFQRASSIRLNAIPLEDYSIFAITQFKNADKDISLMAVKKVYETFRGVTLYLQSIMKNAFASTPIGETCDEEFVVRLIEDYIMENDSRIREYLAFITEAQKELLFAIHEERLARGITSAVFNKKYRLKSPSSTQSAAKHLLDCELITRKENQYSISDPLMDLWLNRQSITIL